MSTRPAKAGPAKIGRPKLDGQKTHGWSLVCVPLHVSSPYKRPRALRDLEELQGLAHLHHDPPHRFEGDRADTAQVLRARTFLRGSSSGWEKVEQAHLLL